jgi:hypothetical protein
MSLLARLFHIYRTSRFAAVSALLVRLGHQLSLRRGGLVGIVGVENALSTYSKAMYPLHKDCYQTKVSEPRTLGCRLYFRTLWRYEADIKVLINRMNHEKPQRDKPVICVNLIFILYYKRCNLIYMQQAPC